MKSGTRPQIEALLTNAIGIIEAADNRAMAADGPVGHVRDEMSDAEWRRLYVALTDAHRLAASEDTGAGLDVERLRRTLSNIKPHICLAARNARYEAERIAAEYARLAAPEEPPA